MINSVSNLLFDVFLGVAEVGLTVLALQGVKRFRRNWLDLAILPKYPWLCLRVCLQVCLRVCL